MAKLLFENNVSTSIAQAVSALDLNIDLAVGTGIRFPAVGAGDWFYATLVDVTTGDLEIVKVTGRVADALTVERGIDGTVPRAFAVNDLVEMRLVKSSMHDIYWKNYINVADGIAGLDGAGKILVSQLPTTYLNQTQMDARYILKSTRGVADGVATLDENAHIEDAQIPATIMRSSARGAASGVAPLDATSKVPAANLPDPVDVSGFLPKVDPHSSGTFTSDGPLAIAGGAVRRKLTVSVDAPTGSGVVGDEWYQTEA